MKTTMLILLTQSPIYVAACVLFFLKRRQKNIINPLTKNTRRPLGCQLGQKLGREQIDYVFNILPIAFAPPLFLCVYLGTPSLAPITVVILCIVAVGFVIWNIIEMVKGWKQIQKTRLGYECELAVGEELNLLMQQGFHVFHDIQFGKFNIDHVVVGSSGVFAVETKGRSKRFNRRGDGKAEYNVTYDNGMLYFPGWQEDEPIKQAERQSTQLNQWLSGAAGFDVKSTPVVVLPGWYVNLKTRSNVPVLAVGAIPGFFNKYQGMPLNPQQLKQIVFQLDKKVRDLEPGQISKPLDTSKK